VDADAPEVTHTFLGCLANTCFDQGEFCLGRNLALHNVLWSGQELFSSMQTEIDALCGLSSWKLQLVSPLRLTMPAGEKGQHRYAQPSYFCDNTNALEHLLSHVRFLPSGCSPASRITSRLTDSALQWDDMAYSRSRQMRIGGLTGVLSFAGAPERDAAARLVFGQYVGVGKNARFGLGLYRIPELDTVRNLRCYPQSS
jgi:hypothetical protein